MHLGKHSRKIGTDTLTGFIVWLLVAGALLLIVGTALGGMW